MQEIYKPEVEIYYENDIPYMKLEVTYQYNNHIYNINFPKIDLSKVEFISEKLRDSHQEYLYRNKIYELGLMPEFACKYVHKLIFNVEPNELSQVLTYRDITPPKEMTLEEIEKQLGYKVKVISN